MIRLLLAFMSLLVALPAVAAPACHMAAAAPTASAPMSHHQQHDPAPAEQPAPEHGCIGCIPPDTRVSGVAAPALLPAAAPVARTSRLERAPPAAPLPPPPRAG